MSELKTVLVEKQKEWKVREGKAIARQQGVEYVEDKVDYSLCPSDLRSFRQSHLSDEQEEEEETVSSREKIPATVGHQLLSNKTLHEELKNEHFDVTIIGIRNIPQKKV